MAAPLRFQEPTAPVVSEPPARRRARAVVGWVTLWLVLTAGLAWARPHVAASRLVVTLRSPEVGDGRLYWDTGEGFDERRSVGFEPYAGLPFAPTEHTVAWERVGPPDARSAGEAVSIADVRLDEGKPMALPAGAGLVVDENGYHSLTPGRARYTFKARFARIAFSVVRHRWAGRVRFTIDGRSRLVNLYAPGTRTERLALYAGVAPGGRRVALELPRVPLDALELRFSSPQTAVTTIGYEPGPARADWEQRPDGTVRVRHLEHRERVHPLQLGVQALVVAALLWGASALWGRIRRRDGLGSRRFWALWLASLLPLSVWLLGQWPAVMTVDSFWFTWREIKTLSFLNGTPWAYNVYVLALTQLFDSPAAVAIAQVLAVSATAAVVFGQALKQGASRWVVVPMLVLFATSVPVGLYTVTLWKDVPFCLAIVWLGLVAAHALARRRYLGERTVLGPAGIVGLAGLLFVATTFRFNGIVYAALPAALFALRAFEPRRLAVATGLYAALFAGYLAVTPAVVTPGSRAFLETFSHCYQLGPLSALSLAEGDPARLTAEERALLDAWVPRERLRSLYHPVMTGPDMARLIERFAAQPAERRARLDALYWQSLVRAPGVFLGDRLAMLVGAAGLSDRIYLSSNEVVADYQQEKWRPIESYGLHRPAVLAGLAGVTDAVLAAAKSPRGLAPWLFNHLPWLALLLGALVAARRLPASAVYAEVILLAAGVMVIAYPASDWRYMYFLTLGGYFLPAIVSAERALAARSRPA